MASKFLRELELISGTTKDGWEVRLDLLEQMQNLIILVQSHQIVFINPAGLRWLGYEKSVLLESEIGSLFHPDYADLVGLGLELLAEEQVIPLKLLHRDGLEIDVEMWVNRLGMPGEEIFIIEARNISDHLKSARALRAREQWLEGIINTVADGIVTVDKNGIVQTFNPAAERIFDFKADEVIGKSIRQLVPDPVAKKLGQEAGQGWHDILSMGEELMGMRKDGVAFPMEASVSEMQQGEGVAYASVVRDITARKRAEEHIRHLAHHDSLTGLPNRFLFGDRLEAAITRADRHQTRIALVFIDLNKFKPVNDTYGHAVGDMVLIGVAKRLSNCLRKTDTVARIGGDEFVAILEEISGEKEIRRLVGKIMVAVSSPETIDGVEHSLGASLGIALYPDDSTESIDLIDKADKAMYLAKRTGGVCLFPDILWEVEKS
ncbi:diguanylate cyclase [Magnetospirillum sp. SS-4]|uniref:diguanylate cyclase domain-containing protein n=1 Tax=Magnetospirillum sp. SS-4 TaxID=2681465 RepID=UPI00138006C5|nr:diguanylate cyclase [Magnetospirillum sp. SS-4]CAA7627305.1 Response regulator [Magnetospirillum sp. SS-4]